jgi:hypothetical protein
MAVVEQTCSTVARAKRAANAALADWNMCLIVGAFMSNCGTKDRNGRKFIERVEHPRQI